MDYLLSAAWTRWHDIICHNSSYFMPYHWRSEEQLRQQIFRSFAGCTQEIGCAIEGVSWKGTNGRKTQVRREGETKPRVPHCYPNLYLTTHKLYIFSFSICWTGIPPKLTIAKLFRGCSSTSAQLTVQGCRALATAGRGEALSRLQNFCREGNEFTTCFHSRKPFASLLPRKAVSK